MSEKSLTAVAVIMVVILLSGLWFYYFYFYRPQASTELLKSQEENFAVLALGASSDSGRLDFQAGIKKALDAARGYENLGKSENAAISTIRAGFLYNKSGDFKTGVPILKTVAFNSSLPNQIRSQALVEMGIAASGAGERAALEAIFRGDNNPVIKRALAGGDPNQMFVLRSARTNLFSVARSIYDYSYASYAVASAKAIAFVSGYKSYQPADRDSKEKEVVALIENGDKLALLESKSPNFTRGNFIYDFLSSGKAHKLSALAQLARVDKIFESKVAAQYKETLNGLNLMKGPSTRGTEGYARYYYASMLADLYGSAKKQEILDAVSPTMSAEGDWGKANQLVIWPFYKLQLTAPKEDQGANTKYVLEIAAAVPEFDKFLKDKGWK